MTQSFTTKQLQALLVYPFKAPNWKNKFLIGSLVVLAGYVIPLVPWFFLYGYTAQIMRRIIVDKEEPHLPEWDDWNRLLSDGLKLLGAALIYSLPLILIMLLGYGLFFLGTFVPSMLAAFSEVRSEAMSTVLIVFFGVAVLSGLVLIGLAMLLGLLVGLFMPAAMAHIVATGQFAAAFRFQEIWAIFRANLAGYLISYALLIGCWMVIGFALQILYLTIIFCCLYPFILPPLVLYTLIIWSVLFAWAYRDGVQNKG